MNRRFKERRGKPVRNAPNRGSAKRINRSGNRKSNKSSLDPSLFVREALITEEKIYKPTRSISDFPIHPALKQRLFKKGFKNPTEVQDKSLEVLLEGRDLMGIAQTGTGKTGAFLIPIIQHLLTGRIRNEYALIVAPTRELALQINEEFQSMVKGLRLYSQCFIGGTNINRDLQALRRSSQVVVGTPGRILDLWERKALDLRKFKVLVLDEFDRMLDMGFSRDMDKILRFMIKRRQTMLFSATIDKSQKAKIDDILIEPVQVKVSSGEVSADHIQQEIVKVDRAEDKFGKLCDMLNDVEFTKVLLFDETKHRVSRLCKKLNQVGIRSDQIQGNKSQSARQKALKSFKKGAIQVLVATDVAARGIDVNNVTHVINYQAPKTYDSYIHRIGRTGRAGKLGKAFTFVD